VTVVLLAVALICGAITFGLLNVSYKVPSSGTIITTAPSPPPGTSTPAPNLAVYSDSGCTKEMTSITWGSIETGSSTSRTVYVKNTGTGTLTLDLSTSEWSPSMASSYLNISWNQQGRELSSGEAISANITLNVNSNVNGLTDFSNIIQISGNQP